VASSATDDWGSWESTHGTPNGTRKVTADAPGEYEARAYNHGSTTLLERAAFTVEK
jgi:hypothetical protein